MTTKEKNPGNADEEQGNSVVDLNEFRKRKEQGDVFTEPKSRENPQSKFIRTLDNMIQNAQKDLEASHKSYEEVLQQYRQETRKQEKIIAEIYLKRARILVTVDAALVGALQELRDKETLGGKDEKK